MDQGGIGLRRADIGDLAAIRELNLAAYAVYEDRMDRAPAPVSHDYTPEIEQGHVWLISGPVGPADLPVGVIVLIPGGDGLLVENVAVAPGAQGRGLGRLLLEFAERRAADLGLGRVTLYTNAIMTENIAIYAKLGYRETGRRREHGFDRVFMEKRLPDRPDRPGQPTSPASA